MKLAEWKKDFLNSYVEGKKLGLGEPHITNLSMSDLQLNTQNSIS